MEEEDPEIEETKRKQEYLKNSPFVEIIVDVDAGEDGEIEISKEREIAFIPNEEKRIHISEVRTESND